MPRTLPAALTTVMDAGVYTPYIRVVHTAEPGQTEYTEQPIKYRLPPTAGEQATVTFRPSQGIETMGYFRLVRGAIINGTPSTISSIYFYTINASYDGRFITLTGEAMSTQKHIGSINDDYQGVIETALTQMDIPLLASYEGSAPWKAYQFYPDGRTPVFSPSKALFTILKQKYLIYAVENGYDGADSEIFFFVATDTRANDYNFTDILFTRNRENQSRQLLWRDEAGTIHTDGTSDRKIHNLGYLESTASAPTNTACQDVGSKSTKLPIHLKYQTGDYVHTDGDGSGFNDFDGRIKVTEVFDIDTEPTWYMQLEKLDWFQTTEGGSVPSTIEAAAPYTPLVTGEFNGTLSSSDNNLQAAMDTIDDHDHDADYAPAAEGVTNGDSHDHVGGDGASLAAGIAAAITAGDSKNPPVGADSVAINDTEASNVFKRVTLTNMRTFFKTTYDTLYASISHTHGGSGGLTYTATTVTTGNVTGVNGNLYVCTIDGMTADRDLNLPTPAAAGERIGVLILDGDDTYELIIKANSVEITRLFIANEYMTFVSTGTGAADWEIEIDGRIACIALVERQAVQSINDSTTTKILLDAAPTNRGNMADVTTNDRVDIRRGGIYNVSGQTSIENLDDTEFINASLNIDGVANVSLRFFNGGSTNIPMVAVLPTKGYTFTAGQYLELYCRHNEGAAQNTGTGGNTPFLYVQEVLP